MASAESSTTVVYDSLIQPLKAEIAELKSKLKTYKEQKDQVKELLLADPTNERVLKLEADILAAIASSEQLIGEKWNSVKQLEESKYTTGVICEAKYEDGSWHAARIEEVLPRIEENEVRKYFVSFIGWNTAAECSLHHLRPFRPPPVDRLCEGAPCKAVLPSTGCFADALIEYPTEKNTVWVTFKGQNNS
eukprot:RCo005324